ncbi:MAG: cysteine desulfurase [Acidobacteriota bacterium]
MTTFGRPSLPLWPLDPAVTYLNHGTVGVTPLAVLAEQRRIRDDLERRPSQFLLRELSEIRFGTGGGEKPRLRRAADVVAAFLGASGDDFVFVDNITTGANAALASLPLAPGDEIVALELGYGGIHAAARHAARRRGATLRLVALPEPVRDADEVVAAFSAALAPATKLAVIDHVTSGSALVLPIERLCAACRERGITTLVDGAHAPGAIALDLPSIGADVYVANLHKWAWTPRSLGFLWTSPAARAALHSPVVSWGLDQGLTAEFDWPGTRDPTAALAAPAAVALQEAIGVERIRAWNHQLAWASARRLAEHWGVPFETPESMIGTMATIRLPEALGSTREQAVALRDRLLFEHAIEVHLGAWKERLQLRISAQIYNEPADYERLADAVEREIRGTR